jgi:hypothetical protein
MNQPKQRYERRGQDFADTLHARSREAAAEQRKLIISLATGCLAVYFLALTSKIEPELTKPQTLICFASVIMMTLSVFAGIYAWHADAQRNYYWAKVEEGKQESGGPEFDTLAKMWKGRLYICGYTRNIFFIVGILTSTVYIILRMFKI